MGSNTVFYCAVFVILTVGAIITVLSTGFANASFLEERQFAAIIPTAVLMYWFKREGWLKY